MKASPNRVIYNGAYVRGSFSTDVLIRTVFDFQIGSLQYIEHHDKSAALLERIVTMLRRFSLKGTGQDRIAFCVCRMNNHRQKYDLEHIWLLWCNCAAPVVLQLEKR